MSWFFLTWQEVLINMPSLSIQHFKAYSDMTFNFFFISGEQLHAKRHESHIKMIEIKSLLFGSTTLPAGRVMSVHFVSSNFTP